MKAKRFLILTALGLAGAVCALPAAGAAAPRAKVAATKATAPIANQIQITNRSRAPLRKYPFQFGRPFLQGVIPAGQCPVVTIGGAPQASQADVKEAWPDGSVKYAVLAVVVPSVPPSGSVTLRFQPGPCGNMPLTSAQMLGSSFNFDAVLSVTGTASGAAAQTVSARAMLQNGDCEPWTQGPVAQTMICADDTAARKYDIGLGDGHRPLRPRFYATFWPALGAVEVRCVAENDLASELEDLAYTLTVSAGADHPRLVYRADLSGTQPQHPKKHWTMTAWTRRFWLGAAPPQAVDIDNNVAYLASTRFIPNYDSAIHVDETAVAREYALWANRPHDIYDGQWDGGVWQNGMPSAGARAEIAPYPRWTVMWLYTGDWRMREMALGLADLAGAFPGQLRETVAGKRLSRADPAGSSTGLGRTVSITDRKTMATDQLTYSYTKASDAVRLVGPVTNRMWSFDGAHQPSPFYPQYLLTGDPWYLQEMYLWAGFSAGRYNGAATTVSYGRGPTGEEGGINDQLRGAGWVLRNRAETAFIAPDADPEKAYFTYLTNDALARWEGSFGIAGTPYDGQAEKVWGAKTGNFYAGNQGPETGKVPPLGNWESNGYPNGKDATITNNEKAGIFVRGAVGTFTSPWMEWFKDYGLGRAAELGFAAGPLLMKASAFPVGILLDSGHPTLVAMYQMPIEANATNAGGRLSAPPGGFFASWTALEAAITPAYLTGAGWDPANNGREGWLGRFFSNHLNDDSYPIWLMPSLAMMVDNADARAAAAWGSYVADVYRAIPAADLQGDPKWAVVPRTDSNKLPAIPTAVPPS